MKVFFKTATAFAALLLTIEPGYSQYKIGITQIVEHPSLNKIRDGIIDVLTNDKNNEIVIVYENAQGNPAIATQIGQKFAGMNLDLIIPISTPSAQAIVANNKSTPVVFAAISDPIEAKIINSIDKPGGNITGVMDIPPLDRQLKFMQALVPDLSHLGVVYNPGEANSVAMLRELTKLASKENITVLSSAAARSADISVASQALVGKVDAIFVGNDNTVVSGLEALIKVCHQNHIPLFTSDPDSVQRGAYAALAYDQGEIGLQAGHIALRILEGEKPGNIAVVAPEKTSVTFNADAAKNLQLPNILKEDL
jgi:putative ABC transport system substrate-binding protein